MGGNLLKFMALGLVALIPSIAFAGEDTNSCEAGSLHSFEKHGKVGFVDCQGEWAIAPQFDVMEDNAYGFGANDLVQVYRDFEPEFINKNGEKAFDASKFSYVGEFSEGLVLFMIDVAEIKDYFTAEEIEAQFGGEEKFNQNSYNDGLIMGYLDLQGNVKIAPRFMPAFEPISHDFHDGMASVKKDGIYGVINQKGEVVIPFEYDWLGVPNEGYIMARKNGKSGLIDYAGKIIIPFDVVDINGVSEGIVTFGPKENGNCTGIHLKDMSKFEYPKYADICSQFYHGLALTSQGELYGFVDSSGEASMKDDKGKPLLFDDVNHFNEGLASVKKDGKYGFIDTSGQFVIHAIYDHARPFDHGLAFVQKNDDTECWIDKAGKEIICGERTSYD